MNLRRDQTSEGWVVFFTFPSSYLSVFRWSVLELSLTLSLSSGVFSGNSFKVK